MLNKTNHNQQYINNEKKILKGYLKELRRVGFNEEIYLKNIADAAGLSHRTVLGHYKNYSVLVESNVKEAVKIACDIIDECKLTGDDCQTFLKKLLVAISRESIHFEIENTRRNIFVWEQILSESRDILTIGWTSYGKKTDEIIFHSFCFEFIGVMYLWGKTRFDVTELSRYYSSLLYLIEHATKCEMLL